jgi:hypothetical protein
LPLFFVSLAYFLPEYILNDDAGKTDDRAHCTAVAVRQISKNSIN